MYVRRRCEELGALGIIDVTILSVKERSGEIGLRRALGATSLLPALGSVIGVIAGTYPAQRAARIEPADTLRGRV